MDIISLGAATKAAMEEGKTRKQTLEVGVRGSHDSVAKRLEALESAYSNSVKKANELIVKDAINIMKAHARLNVVAQSKKYQMQNMIFDDLLDLSGIDTTKSSGYIHDATMGSIVASVEESVLLSKMIETNIVPKEVILNVELDKIRQEQNITLQGLFTAIGAAARLDKNILTDGDLSTWGWDDYPTSELQGFEVRYSNPTFISKIRIYAHTKYYMRGIRVTFDDKEVAYTTNNVIGWFEIELNKIGSSIKITRIPGTHAFDQAISQIEVWQGYKDLTEYQISRDNGVTWQAEKLQNMLVFNDKEAGKGSKLMMKLNLPVGVKLLNYGLTWT